MGKREENKQKRDQGILIAATSLLAEKGFEATRIEDVAERAGVSVGTIYLRYKNKADLLKGVLERFETIFVDALMDEDVHRASFPQRFENIFLAMLKTASTSPELPAIMQLAYHTEIADWVPGETVRAAIRDIIAQSQEEGQLRADVPASHAAAAAHGMVEGVMRHMMINKVQDPAPYIQTLTDASARWLMDD